LSCHLSFCLWFARIPCRYDPSKAWSIKGENSHTVLANNAADSIFNVSGVLPGVHTDNVAGMPIRSMLADPDNHDFRPKPGSKLEAMGAGVYATADAVLWTPGPRGRGGGGGGSDVRCDHSGCAHWAEVRRYFEQQR